MQVYEKALCRGLFRLLVIAALVLITLGTGLARADSGWYDSDWLYRKKITIDSTKVTATLTDFPMLVELIDGNLKSDAQSDGDDILFTASDGTTKLSHEIEKFNGATGELVAWVMIPSLSGSTDTDIYMYYGNASAGDQQDITNVWDANYVMVQHLEESSGQHLDSTANDNDSVSVTVAQQGADIGQMDGADEFDGSDDYIGLGDVGTLSNNTYTLSAWIRNANPWPRQEILWGASSDPNERFRFEVYDSWINFHDNYGMDAYTTSGTIQADTWHHVVATYDYPSQQASIYIDGDYEASDTSFSQAPSNALGDLRIGHGPPGWWLYYFNGIIDEVRISDTVRSADWIETTYNNQSSPSTFYSVVADPGWTQTTRSDFESGTLFQVDTSSSPGDVKLATTGAEPDYVYAFRGNNSKDFWRYDVSANSWTSLADAPAKVKHGGALAWDGGSYIYAFRGNYCHDFWRYDIMADSWTSLAYTPAKVKYGGSLAYDGSSYIYAFRGNNSKSFWQYDISADSWTSLADTPDKVRYGGAITYNGSGYIYGLRGNCSKDFWRYDVSADSWSSRADTPECVAYGGSLAYDGSSYIYAFRGNDSKDFWQYDISADSWTSLVDAPAKVKYGGALTYDGSGYIYGLRGNCSKDFWRYDISAVSWSSRADTPECVAYGGALTMGGVSYHNSGTLTSSTHDTGYSADFGSISWTATTPAGTSIQFQIASNSDGATWNFKGHDGTSGTYYTTSGTGIWAGHDGDRYIKYKAFLSTTDTSKTPTLHDISINYTQQAPSVVAPTVTTGNATLVEETTATIHGTIANDGGEACQYRFEYDIDSGEPYSSNTSWTGSLTTGQSFSADFTGLSKGTKYYFRAQGKNSAGTGSGSELFFLTKPDPPVESTFSATAVSSTQINLTWTKGEGADRTMIRRKTGDYPVDRNDGVQVYFDVGSSVSDTGLSPETTYYYRAWSEVTGCQQWSDGYRDTTATTGGGAPPATPTAVGGMVYPVNKSQVLAPWICLFLIISLTVGGVVFSLVKRA